MMTTNKPTTQLNEWLDDHWKTIVYNAKEFRAWVHQVLIKPEKETIQLSAKTFRWHLKEIILCIVLAFLLAKVDKVQHFFTSFAIDIKVHSYSFSDFFLAFSSNGLVVLWLSYVFWHKPKRLRGWITKLFGDRRDRSYEVHYNLPNGLWWVAVIASMPVLLVNTGLCLSLIRDYDYDQNNPEIPTTKVSDYLTTHPGSVFIVAVLLYLVLVILLKPRTRENISLKQLIKRFWIRLVLFTFSVLIAVILFYFYHELGQVTVFRYIIIGGFIFIPTILLTHFWYFASKCLWKENEIAKEAAAESGKPPFKKLDQYFDLVRYTSYVLSICFFIMLNQKYFTTDERFSQIAGPVAVLLFVFIFYYQTWDLILHNVTQFRRNLAFIVLLLSVSMSGRKEHFQIKYNGIQPAGCLKRSDLEQFFLHWAYDRFQTDTSSGKTNPVFYLVAAEGGGSRSGAWTSSVLTELDAQSGGQFRRNCFAISSVSGGSIGAAVTLSLWDNALQTGQIDNIYQNTDTSSRTNARQNRKDAVYLQKIFKRNYISTAIAGIFFYDFWQSVPLINLFYTSNYSRTDRHQDEENDAVGKALSGAIGGRANNYKTYFKHTSFLRLYYSQAERDTIPEPKTDLPLFFPNTTRVEDGRRGILSPVDMLIIDSCTQFYNPFIAAVDVIGMAAGENPFRSLSISEAAGLSQLFPFVNSNVSVSDSTGRFMDGGAYENMGLTTLFEVRLALDRIREKPNMKKLPKEAAERVAEAAGFAKFLESVSFKFVLIYNIDNHKNEEKISKNRASQLTDPLTALLKTPFSGHTDHVYHKLKRTYCTDDIIEFALIDRNKKKNAAQYHQDIVMSRWLSKYEMDTILVRSEKLVNNKLSDLLLSKQ